MQENFISNQILGKTRMKILLINKFLFPKGGDAIVTLDTGKLLEKNGHEVVFWGMDHPDNPEYQYKNLFVDYIDLDSGGNLKQKLKAAVNIIYSQEAKKKIKQLLESFQPDVVHLHNFAHQISPSILDVFAERNIPAVMTMHDYKLVCPAYTLLSDGKICEKCSNGKYYYCLPNKCTKGSALKSLINVAEMYLHHRIWHIYDKIDLFIAPSKFMMNKVEEMGLNHQITQLYNFIDTSQYEPAYGSEGKTLCYFGRLSPEKGLFTLIEAMKDVDGELKIIGDGPLRSDLEENVQIGNVTNVSFLGYRKGDELQKEIKESRAVVIPSEWCENNPRTVIESFAMGKPVIGSEIGGIPELVRNNITGYTYPPGDPHDLKEKITLILNDIDKCIEMGNNGRKLVESEFSEERHFHKLMKIYESVIDR